MKRARLFAMVAVIGFSLVACEFVMAQPGRGRGGFGEMFNNSLGTLMRGEVRDELGLAEDQVEQLESLQRESRDVMREMFQRGRGEGEGFDWESVREQIQEKMKDLEKQTNDILLPHQIERLEQIVLQTRQRRGTTSALESVAEKLDISDKQLEELKAKSEEAQKAYNEKVAKARQEMQDEILSVLDSEQRAKYKEMVGESFEMNNRRRFGGEQQEGGNRRQGRGNRGDGERRPSREDF